MKRAMVFAAVAVVLASNVWGLHLAKRNRADASGGTVELTERELALAPVIGDSTAMLLELNWRVPSSDRDVGRSPDWLTDAKLTELGFDCHVDLTSPGAREFYSAATTTPVYVVLECEDEARQAAGRDVVPATRLCAIDAGRAASQLRKKYPDRWRYIIAVGVVGLLYEDRNRWEGTPLAQPRLRGRIERILPDRIFVPQPYNKALQALRGRDDRTEKASEMRPRFAATMSWGSRYEPWVQNVRILSAASSETTNR